VQNVVQNVVQMPDAVTACALPPEMALMGPRWYAVYTSANHEKKVAAECSRRSVESFLPLYSSMRRWKDRRVQLQVPLFPGYVFVHLALSERLRVIQVPGVVKLVGFGGQPVALPDEQVEALRTGLNGQLRAEPHPYLTIGRRIRIVRGAFQGAEGTLVRKKGVFRVVLSLELIMRSIAVEVDAADVEPISHQARQV
jgi:transcription antitermination factor NusG